MAATARTATVLNELRRAQRADGPAAVLAIGTAVPVNCVRQDEFTDWYFRVTRSDHLTELKAKMKRMCDKSGIKKRYFHHTEEMIGGHPEFLDRAAPSLGARLRISAVTVPELAAAAAERAIAEWGRQAADITHLVVATNSSANEPGADLRLARLLGLRLTVRRTLLYLHGCSASIIAIRLAKDIAENNRGARVLVACAHATILPFSAPDEAQLDALVAMAIFSDGAGAAIVGADPRNPVERPIFHIVSSSQTTLPGTGHAVAIDLGEGGVRYRMSAEVPELVRGNIERCLVDSLAPLGPAAASGSGGWNGPFWWAVHPGSRPLLDSYEAALGLEAGKLAASRRVLSEYGNMLAATIIFVLDEMRRRRQDGEKEGEDSLWGIMSGLGPGLTIETIVLHASDSRNDG
ncbi:bisdemethoxycurcumin synthase-like [Panicum miliaceum]|uniref:Bisdemethoxycurcumin synthase-like n=1 Tax=Panicum miliaceum TaxID=4540 RepID=A0A3L6Q463_PANMI|nr:bisdemethoxycurcumin synthase-like [Panicum miliaceum]